MSIPTEVSIWRDSFILSDTEKPATQQDLRPTDTDYTALDPQTFDVIEVDALFNTIDHTQTHIGHLQLYRSLVRPTINVQMLQQKQAALRELKENPHMLQTLQQFIKNRVAGEASLYHLLYAEFLGGMSTDDRPTSESDKPAFGGYGYRQFKDGTNFVVEMVQETNALPRPQSTYLFNTLNAICEFGQSRTYTLMHGPIYLANGKFKTKEEKKQSWPTFRFHPAMIKLLPMLIVMFIAGSLLMLFKTMMPAIAVSYVGYGILALTVPFFPIMLLAIGASDRDSVIYPLRKEFRQSSELAKALEAIGMLDELLSFHQYAESSGKTMTLPDIIDNAHHSLTVSQARNPLLDSVLENFVPNDITLDNSHRLLIITGPNSGGKTAYCKTVAQIQLLGQTGGYIPASNAQLVPVEKIFYQVPDPGRLDAGMGRFGHELNRTREIFFSATPRSLVILDELSEGTTFEEKMALSEYILKGFHTLGANTLLVTHNHELCERLQSEAIGSYLQVEFLSDGPTHRLISGISRVSHADHVAAKIGFSPTDIAQHLATQNKKEVDLVDM